MKTSKMHITVGPFNLTMDIDSQPISKTKSASISDPDVIDVINAGAFGICIVLSPLPFDAFLTVTDVSANLEPCDEPPIAQKDILGDWTGTYDCDNFGESDSMNDTIDLTVSSNPDGSYHYEDGTASFNGHLCGNVFKFNGGAEHYTESGTMTIHGDGTATKTAKWNSIPPGASGGDCLDHLARPTL